MPRLKNEVARKKVTIKLDEETLEFYKRKARSQGWSFSAMIYHVLMTHRARYAGVDVEHGSPWMTPPPKPSKPSESSEKTSSGSPSPTETASTSTSDPTPSGS